MHSCVFVLVPEDADLENSVEKALERFDETLPVPPYKRHLSQREIQAMARHYKFRKNDLKKLTAHIDDWCGGIGGLDGQGLFEVSTVNPDGQWDWYQIGGRWDGHLPGNVLPVEALLERHDFQSLLPAALVTPGGAWHEQETFVCEAWSTGRFKRKNDREWEQEVRETLGSFPDHDVVCVDAHS